MGFWAAVITSAALHTMTMGRLFLSTQGCALTVVAAGAAVMSTRLLAKTSVVARDVRVWHLYDMNKLVYLLLAGLVSFVAHAFTWLATGGDLSSLMAAVARPLTGHGFWAWHGTIYGVRSAWGYYRAEGNHLSFPSVPQKALVRIRAHFPVVVTVALRDAFVWSGLAILAVTVLDIPPPFPSSGLLALWVKFVLAGLMASTIVTYNQVVVGIILTQPQSFALQGSPSATRLMAGMGPSAQPLMKALAMWDLVSLSEFSPARRRELFEAPGLWEELLGEMTGRLDSFSADLNLLAKADPMTTMPSRLRQVFEWLTSQPGQPLSETNMSFREFILLRWSIRAVCQLAAHSCYEDNRGVVQVSLKDLLCSLLEATIQIERYVKSPRFLSSYPAYRGMDGYQVVRMEPYAITSELHSGLYLIVTTFYENLSMLKLPKVYAEKLQNFADFKE